MAAPVTIDLIDKLIDTCFPREKSTPWQEGLNRVPEEEYKTLIKAVVFGEPDTVTRRGDDFICTGRVDATMKHLGFTAYSETEVRFTLKRVGQELQISNLSGIKVKAPILPIWVKPKSVAISMRGNDVFVFKAKGLTVKLDMNGDLVLF